jgi:hypothetical protein
MIVRTMNILSESRLRFLTEQAAQLMRKTF